ncbi:MAG: TetR family transcriptional regulator C-terminal domain-containing protein [Pseudomonadota bacterium]
MAHPAKKTRKDSASEKPRRVASKEERRSQLIRATIQSIAIHGIAGTTMGTVTGFAGLSMGIVNFHFDSKENLFQETLRHLAAEHRDQWQSAIDDPSLSPAQKLWAMVEAEFDPVISGRERLAVWSAFYGEAGYRAHYRRIMTDIDGERWDTICDLARKIPGPAWSPEAVADTIEALFDGFCLHIQIYPDDMTSARALDRVRAYLDGVFPGQFPAEMAARDGQALQPSAPEAANANAAASPPAATAKTGTASKG